jgi:hypothetical protein
VFSLRQWLNSDTFLVFICAYPEEFFPRKELTFIDRHRLFPGVGKDDVLFSDRFGNHFIPRTVLAASVTAFSAAFAKLSFDAPTISMTFCGMVSS